MSQVFPKSNQTPRRRLPGSREWRAAGSCRVGGGSSAASASSPTGSSYPLVRAPWHPFPARRPAPTPVFLRGATLPWFADVSHQELTWADFSSSLLGKLLICGLWGSRGREVCSSQSPVSHTVGELGPLAPHHHPPHPGLGLHWLKEGDV